MDTLGLSKVTSLFILTLIERDDGQKKQILETPRLPGHRVVVGCAEVWNMTVKSIRKILYGLFRNQWSSLNEQKLNLCIHYIGSVF